MSNANKQYALLICADAPRTGAFKHHRFVTGFVDTSPEPRGFSYRDAMYRADNLNRRYGRGFVELVELAYDE